MKQTAGGRRTQQEKMKTVEGNKEKKIEITGREIKHEEKTVFWIMRYIFVSWCDNNTNYYVKRTRAAHKSGRKGGEITINFNKEKKK